MCLPSSTRTCHSDFSSTLSHIVGLPRCPLSKDASPIFSFYHMNLFCVCFMAVVVDGRWCFCLLICLLLVFHRDREARGEGPQLSLSPLCSLCIKQSLEHSGCSINILHVNEYKQEELLHSERKQKREGTKLYAQPPTT